MTILNIAKKQETVRLKQSIPVELQDLIEIEIFAKARNQLITTFKIERHRCQIQIDLRRWQSLEIDVRNILFWHEIAKIQNGSIRSDRSTYITLAAGLGVASLDLFTQNIALLATSLLVAGLASFRLYQRHLGEQNIQQLTAADRDAIALAVSFGYDRSTARKLLTSAIQMTIDKKQHRFSRDRSATRLQVLSLPSILNW
jgi:Protein of unknown function (DUF3318)